MTISFEGKAESYFPIKDESNFSTKYQNSIGLSKYDSLMTLVIQKMSLQHVVEQCKSFQGSNMNIRVDCYLCYIFLSFVTVVLMYSQKSHQSMSDFINI